MSAPTPIAASTIAATAFRLMEISPISSFGDDTAQAQSAIEQYPNAMAQCLEAADWSFASQLVALPLAALPENWIVDPTLPNLFRLPGDLVMIRQVGDSPDTAWRRDQGYIWADAAAPLRLRYTKQITNEAALPATFQLAVSHALALLLSPQWMATASKQNELERRGEKILKNAMRQDSRMASPMRYDGRPMDGDWATEARY